MDNKELLALCEKATPGPWELVSANGFAGNYEVLSAIDSEYEANGKLIAAARTELPRLVRENEELRRNVDGALRELGSVRSGEDLMFVRNAITILACALKEAP